MQIVLFPYRTQIITDGFEACRFILKNQGGSVASVFILKLGVCSILLPLQTGLEWSSLDGCGWSPVSPRASPSERARAADRAGSTLPGSGHG